MSSAIAGFITKGPANNTGMVEVPGNHAGHTLQECVGPSRIIGQRPHWRHAVSLDIRLVDHIQTQPITQAIKVCLMWVVGAANGVEVMLLH